ncbi:MAG: hypothetical protein AAF800_01715 [Planctomycetota bacterium]
MARFFGFGGKPCTRRVGPSGGRGAAERWDPRRTLAGLKLLGWVVLVGGVALGWALGERSLSRYVTGTRGAAVTPASVLLVDAPAWLDGGIGPQIKRQVAHALTADPLDGGGLRDAAATLSDGNACPWVAEVRQVRRRPGGVVEVTADYRTPTAMVRDRGNPDAGHVVDAKGVWLDGPVDRAASPFAHLPLITGVHADPPAGGYGLPWPGSDVTAALDLERLLRTEVYADQVTAYDVSHRDLRGRLWLVLYTDGPAIVWGLPPGAERSVEPEAPVKLAALRDWAYRHAGRINVQGRADTVWVYTGTAQIDARPDSVSASRR